MSDHKQAREVNFRLGLVIDEYSNYRTKAGKNLELGVGSWNLHIHHSPTPIPVPRVPPSSRIRDDVFDAVAALCGVVNVVSVAALLAARHQFGKVEEIRQTGKTS